MEFVRRLIARFTAAASCTSGPEPPTRVHRALLLFALCDSAVVVGGEPRDDHHVGVLRLATRLTPDWPMRASIGVVTVVELWRRGHVGWPRSFPIAQFATPPLLLAFAGWGVAAVTDGTADDAGRWVFTLGLGCGSSAVGLEGDDGWG
jgi:hypothetical protein